MNRAVFDRFQFAKYSKLAFYCKVDFIVCTLTFLQDKCKKKWKYKITSVNKNSNNENMLIVIESINWFSGPSLQLLLSTSLGVSCKN